ncbi:hypothetical protein B0H15DRAFT_793705 [Mycena belliarum]|uniref:CxC2-like cysteine cluster KDZ transposase-associated domain-containing protein n=1 Tax=Mycena belliarum TaxID=1033014 RepID=A0AAD6TMW5_9AGAR|nr:hypothetical protein B0H15DRAFT_793704 [Mycena belliae]KAJ7070284.1 hypothetical protein B0H15DRAFT_793705 [Mycena belliae]
MEFRDEFLDEMLRLEGRGEDIAHAQCAGCGTPDPTFRCARQLCHGAHMSCRTCIVQQHRLLPTHWIEEWDGEFFRPVSLKDLGLVVQLGHPPGYNCGTAVDGHKNFCVIDVTGVHTVKVRFCKCDARVENRQQLMRVQWWPASVKQPQTCATFAVIRLFRLLNCQGKVSAHDFVRSLELLTNNDGLTPTPDRRRAFRNIIRQYRMTLMMKRAGRAHSPSGVHGTGQGELALACRACPQPGRNLPDGWDTVDWDRMPEDRRYIYFLFLAQDCNFRLINRDVSTAAKDPIIGDGLGYFVNHAKYTEFLRAHVSEEEISSCSGFQAMFLANRKRVKGLRTTGVGGVTCARHNMWRPNGIGDLQLGERFCNMDFILLSAVLQCIIFYLILSYDIACQFGKNFWTRMLSLPPEFHLTLPHDRVWFKVPNFHLPPHKPACHSPYSFHFMWGAGRTHGETVEQNWEFTNGAAASTKMMGIGGRHVTLEDLFGFHNWRRLVSWRGIFKRRMTENVEEGQIHRDAFEAFNTALQEQVPELVERWRAWVADWESRQHTTSTESPFVVEEKGMTMKDIRLKLAREELLRNGEGVEVEREDTPSTFVIMGLEIEESQRYLAIDVKAIANPTPTQEIDFVKRRGAILKRIRAFRRLQRTYMPNVRRFLTISQRALWDTEADRDAEAIRLFMPSDIADKVKRLKACPQQLADVEAELREGEGHEALETIRQGLRLRTMTNRFRVRNMTGQRALTRGQGVLRQNNVRIHKAKLRYRYARNALLRLRGNGEWERKLQVLEDSDIRALNERALTEEEKSQRETVHDLRDVEEGGVGAYGVVALGESRRTLSWIWYTSKAGVPEEAELVEALRVEWCKAYARSRRWTEDTVLVEEEMRRTIEYGVGEAAAWLERATGRSNVDDVLGEGLNAYAKEQADREARTCEQLRGNWMRVRERGRAFLAGETGPSAHVVTHAEEERQAEADDDDDDEEGEGDEVERPDYEEDEEEDGMLD